MPFDAEDIERMPPAVRAEIQEWLLVQHFARQRRTQFGNTRAHSGNTPWPRHVWHVNDSQRRLERELAIRDGLPAR